MHVSAERQQDPPRFTSIHYELQVLTDEPEREEVDLLQRNLVKYGTVFNTLAEVCEVSGTVVAERSEQAAEAEETG